MYRSLAVITSAVLALGAATVVGPAQAAPGERTITYQGYQVAVPKSWAVVDLAEDPTACVRFDRPAVYLGTPAAQQNCPAHLVGRTAGLILEPLAGSAPRSAAVAARTSSAAAAAPSADNQIQVGVDDAGVLVTAVHSSAEDEASVRRILDRGVVTSKAKASKLVAPKAAAVAPAATVVAPGTLINQRAFDACAAPSLGAMNAWKASPFKAVGIYISGASRACAQGNLTASWITSNANNGWTFLPIDVGLQANCTSYSRKMSLDLAVARNQGWDAAGAAAQAAQNLGLAPGSALYSDIENYNSSNIACRDSVLSYVTGWTERLRSLGYLSGVYSSASSGGRDLANAAGNPRWLVPDHLWFAWWNNRADTDSGTYFPASAFSNHQRVHQYIGDHNETHGGVTINIDSNFVDVAGDPPPPMQNGSYRIKAEVGGFDLDVQDCQSQNGANVRMWDRILTSPCQKWNVVRTSGNTFKIIDGNTGKPLQVAGCGTADATPVDLWDDNGQACQTWSIEPIIGGAYKIIGTASGDSLDVAGCSAARGADVIIWPFHGGSCQRWYFSPV
ncbi:glycoside hydrolase domain-containing protein [Kribbella sandramycini]|uniref:glycoside hydrolase domain-containing protein n=1 Tax=Kribbella sandramycini TaxID=60450 RepID=UPI0031E43965